jgi:hypothetical protein
MSIVESSRLKVAAERQDMQDGRPDAALPAAGQGQVPAHRGQSLDH